MEATVLSYGGGRQTVAICLLIAKGILAKPDRIVMADTGRENPMTFAYLETYTRPLMRQHGLEIEIAPRSLAKVDLYSHNGALLVPAYTRTGKLSGFCSGEWKRDVVERYLRTLGITGGITLLGLAFDERKRWSRSIGKERHNHRVACPLVEMMLTTADCLFIIKDYGWPEPFVSSCWMCPNKKNKEWRYIKENYPELWGEACRLDVQMREDDEQGGVWLHHSRVPLAEADLSDDEPVETVRQCGLGTCFV